MRKGVEPSDLQRYRADMWETERCRYDADRLAKRSRSRNADVTGCIDKREEERS